MKKVVKKPKKKMTIEDLAIMTQKGFWGLEDRINERFEKVEKRLGSLEDGQKKIHNDVLGFHDTFVKKSEFNNLLLKVENLGKKPKVKSK